MKVLKKSYIIIIIVVLFVFIGNYLSNKPKEFPHEDVFNLDIYYKDNVALGEKTNITVSFSNKGNNDYYIEFSNDIFDVLINDKRITINNDNATIKTRFTNNETRSKTIALTTDKIGVYKIEVIVAFKIRLSSTNTKEYYYKKSTSINVTE